MYDCHGAWLSAAEVAQLVGISKHSVFNAVNKGRTPQMMLDKKGYDTKEKIIDALKRERDAEIAAAEEVVNIITEREEPQEEPKEEATDGIEQIEDVRDVQPDEYVRNKKAKLRKYNAMINAIEENYDVFEPYVLKAARELRELLAGDRAVLFAELVDWDAVAR